MFMVKMEKQKYFITPAILPVLFACLILINEIMAASRHRFIMPPAKQMPSGE
jgi:hypothetical protein